MAQPKVQAVNSAYRCNLTKGNVPAGRRLQSNTPVKPSKHDVLAQVWHFVHYVEDFMTGHSSFDKKVCRKKCEQVKRMLEATEE